MSYSAVYRRPSGLLRADWVSYSNLATAMLGPECNQFVGTRVGYMVRPLCGPPQLVGTTAGQAVDLAR